MRTAGGLLDQCPVWWEGLALLWVWSGKRKMDMEAAERPLLEDSDQLEQSLQGSERMG